MSIPGDQGYLEKTDLLSIGNLIKYGRPDWINSIMSRFYGELRGFAYMYKSQSIEKIFTYSTNKRCTVLLFQGVTYNPVNMIELMSEKVGIKITYFNALRDSLNDLKTILENNNKKQSWIVVENINMIDSSKASLMIRETTNMLEKFSSIMAFRVWVTYQLPLRMLNVESNVSPGNGEIPLWFGTCYYIFLDSCRNVSEEMRQLHRPELMAYSAKASLEMNKSFQKRDKEFIELAQNGPAKSQAGNHGYKVSSTKNLSDIKAPSIDDSKSHHDKSIAEGLPTFDLLGDKLVLENIEALVEQPIVLIDKRIRSNLMDEIQRYQSSEAIAETFRNNKDRTLYVLKLIAAIMRHRRDKVGLIFGSRVNFNYTTLKDKQLHAMLSELIDVCCQVGHGDPYRLLLNGFLGLFSDWFNLSDPVCSPLIVNSLFKSFLIDLPKSDTIFDFCGVKYQIPGVKSFSHDFGRLFIDSVLSYPKEDSSRLFGLRPNEEIIMEYNQSKACFQFLNSRMSILELAADHSNYLEDFDLVKFAEDNKKKDQEAISRFFLNNIEYGYNLIQNHEFKTEMVSDLKKMINNILSMFSEKSYKSILVYLDDSQYSQQSSKIMDESSSGSEDKEVKDSSKRTSIVSRSSRKAEQRVSLLEFHGDRFAHHHSSLTPAKEAIKSITLGLKIETPKETSEDSPDYRMLANDFYMQTGVSPKLAKGYMTFNMNEKNIRNSFRRSLILQEYRTLERLLGFLSFELKIGKFYLDGDVLSQHKQQGKVIVDCVSNNQIPPSWLPRLANLNIDVSSFKDLVKSVLVKLDALYAMAVEITNELPPIMNLSNFLSPKGLLSNILACNSIYHKVPLASSVIMLMQSKGDTDKIYSRSTVWTIGGLKIRGGALDPDGKLIDEEERAKPYDLGPLHLEITQFNEDGEEGVARCSSLVNNGEISLMMNVNFQDEPDKTEEMLKEVYEVKKASICDAMQKSKSPIPSGNITPSLVKSRRDSLRATLGGGGFLNIPGQSSFGGNSPRSATSRNRKSVTTPVIDKPKVYVVRLPMLLSATFSFNPLADLPLFLYCYSMHPQSHWLDRCSYVTLSNFDSK